MPGPILIVEDDKKTASLVALYLEREGFQTVVASDGLQALELVKRHKPAFVILDLMLPGLDGMEVCRELRKFSTIPIIMLTARVEEIDRLLGLELGADDYICKPFSPREVVARVRAGDRDAYRVLVRRYQDLLYGHALRQTGDRDAAADLAQAAQALVAAAGR